MSLASFKKSPYDTPGPRTTSPIQIAAVVATSDATRVDCLFRAPVDLKVTGCWIVTDTAYTGAATNYRSTNLQNRGAAGTGTTEIASWDGSDTNDLVAFVPQALTLSTTAANLNVDEGHIVGVQLEEVGTGLGLAAGTYFIIEWEPR